jgi:hypothetical protein
MLGEAVVVGIAGQRQVDDRERVARQRERVRLPMALVAVSTSVPRDPKTTSAGGRGAGRSIWGAGVTIDAPSATNAKLAPVSSRR